MAQETGREGVGIRGAARVMEVLDVVNEVQGDEEGDIDKSGASRSSEFKAEPRDGEQK